MINAFAPVAPETPANVSRPSAPPAPVAQPASRANALAPIGAAVDRVERAVAHTPPLLVAGGVVAGAALIGGAAVAAPAVLEGAALAEEGGSAVGAAGAAVRGRTFAATAGREIVREYHAGAAKLLSPSAYTEPAQLGKALGAQAWTATTDFARSSIVGGGIAAGAWAVSHGTRAVEAAVSRVFGHAESGK